MGPIASQRQAYTGDSADISQQRQDGQEGTGQSSPALPMARDSTMKKQLLTVRRALWKLVDQFTSPRQRALHKLYQEMADIKSALATLESQRSTSPAGNGLQGAATKASNL